MKGELTVEQPILFPVEADNFHKLAMIRVVLGVHEVDSRPVGGVHAEHNEFYVLVTVGELVVCVPIGNGHGAHAQCDSGGGVHRVHAHRIAQLSDVVDTVAVSRVRDQILLHPVARGGQRLHVFGQRGRARFASLYQYRNIHRRVCVYLMTHVKHEVVGGRGFDYDGHGRHLYHRRRRVIAAAWTRRPRVVALRLCRRRHDQQRRSEC